MLEPLILRQLDRGGSPARQSMSVLELQMVFCEECCTRDQDDLPMLWISLLVNLDTFMWHEAEPIIAWTLNWPCHFHEHHDLVSATFSIW